MSASHETMGDRWQNELGVGTAHPLPSAGLENQRAFQYTADLQWTMLPDFIHTGGSS
jgi:hypothetical protein